MTAVAKLPTVDELAQEIRRVDGNHSLGAGALAEALMPFLAALSPAELGGVDGWPEYVMLRDTKLHDDMGGLGQRIFTTAGAGYEKVKYVRADLSTPRAAEAVTEEMVEAFARVYWKGDWPFKPDTEANRELIAEFRDVIKRGLTAALLTPPSAKGE